MRTATLLLLLGHWSMPPQNQEPITPEMILSEAQEAAREYCARRNQYPQSLPSGQSRLGLLRPPVVLPEHESLHSGPAAPRELSISGVVMDAAGAILPGVRVSCLSEDGALIGTLVSDDGGRFRFSNVSYGKLRLTAEMRGFQQAQVEVDPPPQARVAIPIVLQVGPYPEVVSSHFPKRLEGPQESALTLLSLEWPQGFLPLSILRTDQVSRVPTDCLSEKAVPYREVRQWSEDLEAARRIYRVALDVPSGPERWVPMLSHLVEQSQAAGYDLELPGLTLDERALMLAAFLDRHIVSQWMRLEGLPRRELSRYSDVGGALELVLQEISAGVNDLESLGAFEQPHLRTVRPFLEARLGLHLVHRERRAVLPGEPEKTLIAVHVGPAMFLLDPTSMIPERIIINDD